MNRTAQRRKNAIRWAIAVVLVIDLALVVVNWRASAADPRELLRQKNILQRQHDLLAGDVKRAMDIRQSLPDAQREWDEFFAQELREASSGYSAVVADLSAIGKEAGASTSAATFRQHEIANRGLVEVEVAATVEGDYTSLVKFIKGLQRSRNFYVLDSLTLASGTTGANVKLNLELRTYFRA
jgi:Tfp pilus assembly protein PilO